MIPISVHAGFLAKFFNDAEAEELAKEPKPTQSPVDTPLLNTVQNPDPIGARGGAEIIVDGDVLVSTGPVGADIIAEQKTGMGEIKVHTVRPCTEQSCETISHIADMYGVTTNTILWANDISDAKTIQPGDTLVILPIVGVRHVVKSGETVNGIAKKYESDAEEILSYNQLASADELSVGDTLIIPGGALHSTIRTSATASPVKVSGANASYSAGFSHPAPGSRKTQGIHGFNAVDLAVPGGGSVPVRAAAAGEVIVSKPNGWNGGYGSYIVIRHPGTGVQTLYAHLQAGSNLVGVGEWVTDGAQIGTMGNTGKSTGTHLHFEVRGARNPF